MTYTKPEDYHIQTNKESQAKASLGIMMRRCSKCNEAKHIYGGTIKNKKFICKACKDKLAGVPLTQ